MLAVIMGAFGSHALKEVVLPERLASFEIGVRYQFFHALAIITVGILFYFGKKSFLKYAGWAFLIGIILFSGSLYLLAVCDIFPVPIHIVGPLTPVGGIFFIAGWMLMFLATYQSHQ